MIVKLVVECYRLAQAKRNEEYYNKDKQYTKLIKCAKSADVMLVRAINLVLETMLMRAN